MKKLRPFYGRVAVMDSPVDEEQRGSGLIVPVKGEGFQRGVVLEYDSLGEDNAYTTAVIDAGVLVPGTVIFYRSGVRIGDVTVVELSEILAYEADA